MAVECGAKPRLNPLAVIATIQSGFERELPLTAAEAAVVLDLAGLAVHRLLAAHHAAPERLADGLRVSQGDAESLAELIETRTVHRPLFATAGAPR